MAIELAPAFTLDDARATGLRKDQVYELLGRGEIERVGRGAFVRPIAVDPAFATIAAATAVNAAATLCLTSALVYHDLSDAIPFATDIALPRGTRHPKWSMLISLTPGSLPIRRRVVAAREGVVGGEAAEEDVEDSVSLVFGIDVDGGDSVDRAGEVRVGEVGAEVSAGADSTDDGGGGGEQCDAAGFEDAGIGADRRREIALVSEVIDEPAHPDAHPLPGGEPLHGGGVGDDGLDLFDVEVFQQRLAGGEVPVKGGDAHTGPCGDDVECGVGTVGEERFAGGVHDGVEVSCAVGSAGSWYAESLEIDVRHGSTVRPQPRGMMISG